MTLRNYQQKAIDSVFEYFRLNKNGGNPLVVAPTGSGKSHIIAGIIRTAIEKHPATFVVMLAHRKELLQQNAEKIIASWPGAPVGIYSAGLRKKQINQITVAGIASVFNKFDFFGHQNLVIVDEAHLIPKAGRGMYRTFIEGLTRVNPRLRVIGLTATPYRLDSGMLIDGDDKLFTDISYNIEIRYLIDNGYLSPLVSKPSKTQADLSSVRIRGGEFVSQDAELIMNEDALTNAAIDEVFEFAKDRKSWIFFCAGVKHAEAVSQKLRERGVLSHCVVGETDPHIRADILSKFKSGRIPCIVNCDVLTTGFDAPNIDLIVLLRPTKSVGLYVQMCGRGSRLSPGKKDCLVLDFAGNIERFGPLDMVKVKKKKNKSGVEAQKIPTKICESCGVETKIATRICPYCDHEFPAAIREKHGTNATNAPILSAPKTFEVDSVDYSVHIKNDRKSFRVTYYCGVNKINEFFNIDSVGIGRIKFAEWWRYHAIDSDSIVPKSSDEAVFRADELKSVSSINCIPDGKFWKVISVFFGESQTDSGIDFFFDEERV